MILMLMMVVCDNNTKIQYHLLMPHQTSVAYV
jgi:hypothetical protein